jgi:hypothetical protein
MEIDVTLPEPGIGAGLACGLALLGALRWRRVGIA